MAQVREGMAYVEEGSTTVRFQYRHAYANLTGSFAPGDALTWPGGTGTIVDLNSDGSDVIEFIRLTGSPPAEGDTITGPSGTVESISIHNGNPDWSTRIPSVGPRKFTTTGGGSLYDVAGTVSEPDTFELTAPFVIPTFVGDPVPTALVTEYGVQHQFTKSGFPLLVKGDLDAVGLVSDAFARLEQSYSPSQLTASTTAITQPGTGNDAVIIFDNVIQNEDGFWGYNPATGEITIPGGVKAVGFAFHGIGSPGSASFDKVEMLGSTMMGSLKVESTFSGLNGVFQMNYGMVPVAVGDVLTFNAINQQASLSLGIGTWLNLWRAG